MNVLENDRTFYVLRGDTVIDCNAAGGILKKTRNLKKVLAGEPQSDLFILGDELDYAAPLGESGRTLYIVDHRTPLFDSIRSYLSLSISALIIVLISTVLLAFLIAHRFLEPVRKLTESAAQMEESGEFHPVETLSADEMGVLTRTFNKMGERISKNIQNLRSLLQIIPKPLFAVNRNNTIVFTNEAFKSAFPTPLPKTFFERGTEETRYLIHPDQRFFIVYRVPLLLDDGAEGALFLMDDITESEAQETARKQFFANVSHELKTPLTIIKSYSETLQDEKIEPATREKFIRVIEQSADQMTAMVNQLLELSKTEIGANPEQIETDLPALAKELLDMLTLEFRKKDLRAELIAPPSRVFFCAPDRIRRVLLNLLSNSIKYSNPGGKVTVTVADREGGVILRVAHLFEQFYRVDKTRSRATGGTGLGLSIVNEIMKDAGGTVEVESTYGKGSVFTCFFPDKR